jgi:hypothetical protein
LRQPAISIGIGALEVGDQSLEGSPKAYQSAKDANA